MVGDSSSFSSLSTGSSGMARGSSSLRGPLTALGPNRLGLLRLPAAPERPTTTEVLELTGNNLVFPNFLQLHVFKKVEV